MPTTTVYLFNLEPILTQSFCCCISKLIAVDWRSMITQYSLKQPFSVIVIDETIIEDSHHLVHPQPAAYVTSHQ